jgi:hypothetical protein
MNRKQRMGRKKLMVASLVAVPLMVGGGVVVAESAFAGTNGQAIQLCQPQSDYRSAKLTGPNQDGKSTTTDVHNLTQACTKVDGYIWKGDVQITWTDPATQGAPASPQTKCTVPQQSAQDTEPCFGPNNRGGGGQANQGSIEGSTVAGTTGG